MAQPSKLTEDQWAQVAKWETERKPRPEIVELIREHYDVDISRSAIARHFGNRPPRLALGEGAKPFKVYLTDAQLDRVRDAVYAMGLRDGSSRGNISQFLRAIAEGEYDVTIRQMPQRSGTLR